MGLDNWNFDAMQVCDMIGRNALPIVFCRFVAIYDFVEVLKVDPELLCNFAKKIQAGYSTSTRFNGYARAIDMVQSMHYFLMRGMEGYADANSDNQITAGELHAYVQQNVIQQSSGSQTPEIQGDANRVLVRYQ